MHISEILKKESILLDASASSKDEAISLLVSLHEKAGNLLDAKQFLRDVKEREKLGNTALVNGVALPHAKSRWAKSPSLAAVTVPNGIDCGALDGKKTRIFFMIAAPGIANLHIEVLSSLSGVLMDEGCREKLISAKTTEDFLSVLKEKEMAEQSAAEKDIPQYCRILAVTACPAGIAHTYMAQEALAKAARELGYSLRVETVGAGGTMNALTREEIERAQVILVAADRAVDMERFSGKKLLRVSVSEAVYRPRELLEKAVLPETPVYECEKNISFSGITGTEIPKRIYRHLMNGVSHMLPFMVAGGLLIALSFLFDHITINPQSFGTNTTIAAFLNKLGNIAMDFMLPVLSGYIASSIADRPGLAAGFVGGFLANMGTTLMLPNGSVSAGFLGALFAGFAAGYIVLILIFLTKWFPRKMDSVRTVLIIPVAGVLLIGIIMCTLNPMMAKINTQITLLLHSMESDGGIFVGVILGAMMALDLGGPVNKAAYVFATAALASGDCEIMASVMLGGMVPPLATALGVTFFRNSFSKAERRCGPVNYIMGLCFITEGAIPFAAADPLRVIPACMLGSAVAGGMSMAFHCTIPVPHGGIIVFPLAENLNYYILSLVVGTVIGTAALILLKKTKKT